VATECPGVIRAAAISVDDPEWGQTSVLFVESAELADGNSVMTFMRRHLAHFKCPRQIIVLDRLPTTALDKIDRVELHRMLE
jgi:acyl-CoA synthetase (AMP-forming)/AMP-acid ligase II